jgi:hypothetical protein
MPTQIPVRADRSPVPSAIDVLIDVLIVLMLSLLAAAIDGIVVLIIVWAYT